MLRLRTPWIVLLLAAALVPLTGCGDDDDGGGGGAPESSTTASSPTEGTATTTSISTTTDGDGDTLHIVVTNDDGIGAEGIDLLTQALVELDGVEVTIVAPAENQSGKGDTTTGGELVGEPATTASGLEGIAVDGTPADTMVWAFEQGGLASLGFEDDPDLVISGINAGQNIGPFAPISGTVGAARQAARHGVPALAASQGLILDDAGEEVFDYERGVEAVLEWLEANRDALTEGVVTKIDIPTCDVGTIRGTVEAPLWIEGDPQVDPYAVDCGSTETEPANDVVAFTSGFVVLTEMPVEEWDAALER